MPEREGESSRGRRDRAPHAPGDANRQSALQREVLDYLLAHRDAKDTIDGIDGLASGIAAISGIVLSIIATYEEQPRVALIAAALAGASQVVRKFGLAAVPHPFLAAAVTASSSLVVSVLTMRYVEKTQESWRMNRQCFWWFLAAGIVISFAMTCIYYALDLGKVSVVIPIASTGPLFSLILTALFLRDVERVTARIVISAAMIVGGVAMIS